MCVDQRGENAALPLLLWTPETPCFQGKVRGQEVESHASDFSIPMLPFPVLSERQCSLVSEGLDSRTGTSARMPWLYHLLAVGLWTDY